MTILSLYEKLESLLRRLPVGLHQPILREMEPLKTLFLEQRPARVVLVGDASVSRADVLNSLFATEVAFPDEDTQRSGAWIAISSGGNLRVLDARRPATPAVLSRPVGAEPADIFLFLRGDTPIDENLAADLDHAAAILAISDRSHEARPCIFGVQVTGGDDARLELHGALASHSALVERTEGAELLSKREQLAEAVAIEIPPAAQLEWARLSRHKELQRQIAGVLVKSVTAICGLIGAQPIPFADFPFLMGLQATMVGSIAHASGRDLNAKLVTQFIAALGANVGAALLLREGTRAVVKFIPGWGNAISGGVAAAGTYAIGRAATSYFIDGVSLADARDIFRRRRRKPTALIKDK
jgi:uncharacterized protein